jgi:hypothetical protein
MDAMMFPSEDPFAYPNQPPMDPANQHPGNQTPQSAGGQAHDTMQFYIPNMYDGIEGQLLEPIPSYLMQQQGQRPGQHGGLDATAQMYCANPSMLAMLTDHAGHAHQQQPQHHHQEVAQHQHQHPHQHPHPQGGMIDEMVTDTTFRGDWDEMLGNPGYR